MPSFGNDEYVEVLVDGEIGYRGTYGDVNANLNTIVSKIMEKRAKERRVAAVLRPDTVCIAAEGKGRRIQDWKTR